LDGLLPAPTASVLKVGTRDAGTENLVSNSDRCPMLTTLKNQFLKSPNFLKHFDAITFPLINEISTVFGISEVDLDDIYDCIQSFACHNKSLPPGLTQALYQRIIAEVNTLGFMKNSFVDSVSGYNYAQIAMADFMSEFFDRIKAVRNGLSNESFAFYSGQSSTILPILIAYDAWVDDKKGKTPPYASLLLLEYVETANNEELINLSYQGKMVSLNQCQNSVCTFDQFQAATEYIIKARSECLRTKGN